MSNSITISQVREVFDAWVVATGRQPGQTKPSPERMALIFKWLKVGYGVEELKAAMIGVTRSPWHKGENPGGVKYDDLKVVLKGAANIEMFRDLGNGTMTILPTDPVDRRVMNLLRSAGEHGQARLGDPENAYSNTYGDDLDAP